MKLTIIGCALFFFTFSVSAGTFIETFNDADLEEWQELIRNDAAPGSWEVLDRELHAVSLDGWTRLLTIGDETWQNYTIEVKVKPLQKHSRGSLVIAARINETWLMFCEIGDDLFPESNANCRVGDFHDLVTVILYLEAHPPLKLDTWYTLKLSVKGGTFTFWVNDTKIVETGQDFIFRHGGQELINQKAGNLDHFLTGGAGFGLTSYTARFDDIIITGKGVPDKGRLSVMPGAKLSTTWGDLKDF